MTDGFSTKTLIHDNKYKNLLHNLAMNIHGMIQPQPSHRLRVNAMKITSVSATGETREEGVVVDGGDVDCR